MPTTNPELTGKWEQIATTAQYVSVRAIGDQDLEWALATSTPAESITGMLLVEGEDLHIRTDASNNFYMRGRGKIVVVTSAT